jgi:hypothetical protein
MLPACSAARFQVSAPTVLVGDGAMDGKNEVIVHPDAWPATLDADAIGQTILYVNGTTIVEADIHVNAFEYAFAIGDVPGKHDLRAVLTHELGHVLGIGHSMDPRATMYAGLPPGIGARSLDADDVTAVCTLYPASGTASPVACDEGGPACPSTHACVGHECERTGDPGTIGSACLDASNPLRCEGESDDSECVATTVGDRCARACGGDAGANCGAGLHCVTSTMGDAECLPTGSDFAPSSDAGATSDAAIDESTSGSSSGHGGCSMSHTFYAEFPISFAIVVAIAMLRRSKRLCASPIRD